MSTRTSSPGSIRGGQILRDASALRPWIAQLTRRRCLDAGGEQGAGASCRRCADDGGERGSRGGRGGVRGPRGAVRSLPQPCQDILDRFFAQDQSYKTISDELEIPSGTIASRIARCLGKLKDELEGRNEAPGGGLGGRCYFSTTKRVSVCSSASCAPPPPAGCGPRRSCRALAARSTTSSRAPRRISPSAPR